MPVNFGQKLDGSFDRGRSKLFGGSQLVGLDFAAVGGISSPLNRLARSSADVC
jgi:hypothetical protein